MNRSVDFILPTCAGIPDSMWIVASASIEAMLNTCWKLFAVFLVIKFIHDGLGDIVNGRFELRAHLKTILQAILIGSFLKYYKFFLMTFDNFIELFCFPVEEVLQGSIGKLAGNIPDYTKDDSWLNVSKIFLKILFEFFPKLMTLSTHAGAIKVMHYLKSVGLLLASQLGPIAALFSLLPGPFKKGFASWAKSYINMSCWAITLNIFWALAKAFMTTSFFIKADSATSFAGETAGATLLSLVFFIAIFLTPTWTSKFIGGAIVANLGSAISMASDKLKLAGGINKMITKSR
jgi:hypothetical protein